MSGRYGLHDFVVIKPWVPFIPPAPAILLPPGASQSCRKARRGWQQHFSSAKSCLLRHFHILFHKETMKILSSALQKSLLLSRKDLMRRKSWNKQLKKIKALHCVEHTELKCCFVGSSCKALHTPFAWCIPNLSLLFAVQVLQGNDLFYFILFHFVLMHIYNYLELGPQCCWGFWRRQEWKQCISADDSWFRSHFDFMLTYICTPLASQCLLWCVPLKCLPVSFQGERADEADAGGLCHSLSAL